MKRIALLAAALVMVLGSAVSAFAAPEVSISGDIQTNAIWGRQSWNFQKDNSNDDSLVIRQRTNLYFTITANENLKGVIGLRSDNNSDSEWGGTNYALANPGGSSKAQLNIRDLYIDYNWPGTSVDTKVGVYTVGLPAAVGGASMIIAERAGAAMVSAPITDNVSVLAGFARLQNDNSADSSEDDNAQLDAYIAEVPLSFEGVKATPYFMYANGGDNNTYSPSGTNLTLNGFDGYWLGSSLTVSLLDPFVIKGDLAYGRGQVENDDANISGWMFDAELDYTGLDFMTPSIYFAYTSGDDGDGEDAEVFPTLDGDWAMGSFYFGNDGLTGGDIDNQAMGFWTVGLALKDIQSFTENLTHNFYISYIAGTNDEDSVNTTFAGADKFSFLTTEDHLVEVDFNSFYKVYDNLSLICELAYINADFDEDTWGGTEDSDAYKIATGIIYQF